MKKNQSFIDEGSKKGQIIIRDLPLRQPEVFLKYFSLNKILKILSKIFNDKFILDNMMASNSINVKKNIVEKFILTHNFLLIILNSRLMLL